MNRLRGIILYDIQLNGDLNGVYTNNHPDTQARLYTETARLRQPFVQQYHELNMNNGTMVYDCFYFDVDNQRVNCTLKFEITNSIIQATWSDNTRILFTGEGYQMNERQIAITYTD